MSLNIDFSESWSEGVPRSIMTEMEVKWFKVVVKIQNFLKQNKPVRNGTERKLRVERYSTHVLYYKMSSSFLSDLSPNAQMYE